MTVDESKRFKKGSLSPASTDALRSSNGGSVSQQHLTRCIFVVTVGRRRLLNGDWIGRRKGILERFIKRFFLALAR